MTDQQRPSETASRYAADGDRSVTLFVNLGKKAATARRGREAALGRGSAVPVSDDPGGTTASDGYLGVVIPHEVLASLIGNLDGAITRPIRRGNVPLRLLAGYLRQLSGCNLATPQLRRAVEAHIQDLAALAVGANAAARNEGMGAVAAARLGAARAHIAARFNEPALTIAAVAQRLGVSPRYLQRLFEASGTSFTAYVNELRLQRAVALLTEPHARKRRISDIALEVGFSDLSHFNRLFRSRFGATPRGVRAGDPLRPAPVDTERWAQVIKFAGIKAD